MRERAGVRGIQKGKKKVEFSDGEQLAFKKKSSKREIICPPNSWIYPN